MAIFCHPLCPCSLLNRPPPFALRFLLIVDHAVAIPGTAVRAYPQVRVCIFGATPAGADFVQWKLCDTTGRSASMWEVNSLRRGTRYSVNDVGLDRSARTAARTPATGQLMTIVSARLDGPKPRARRVVCNCNLALTHERVRGARSNQPANRESRGYGNLNH